MYKRQDIRSAENPISGNRKIINTIAVLFLGIALGTFSNFLDFRDVYKRQAKRDILSNPATFIFFNLPPFLTVRIFSAVIRSIIIRIDVYKRQVLLFLVSWNRALQRLPSH